MTMTPPDRFTILATSLVLFGMFVPRLSFTLALIVILPVAFSIGFFGDRFANWIQKGKF